MRPDWRNLGEPVRKHTPELVACGSGLMAAACLAFAVWAAWQYPPAGWFCYGLALGWSLMASLAASGS